MTPGAIASPEEKFGAGDLISSHRMLDRRRAHSLDPSRQVCGFGAWHVDRRHSRCRKPVGDDIDQAPARKAPASLNDVRTRLAARAVSPVAAGTPRLEPDPDGVSILCILRQE
jgi:hypothetical protein